MQTLEAVLALIIILGVIIFSISLREPPEQTLPEDIRLTQDAILSGLEYDQDVREYIMDANGLGLSAISVYASLLGSVPDGIRMGFSVDDAFTFPHNLHANKQNVYADSVILANESGGYVRTFSLYLWYIDEELSSPCPISQIGGLSACTTGFDCINEMNISIGNATVMAMILTDFDIQCDATSNCTMQPFTC